MKEFNVLQPTVRCAEPGDIISPVFLYEPMYVLQNMPHPDPYDSHREGCVKAISLATGRLMEYHTRNYVILLDDDILVFIIPFVRNTDAQNVNFPTGGGF